MNDKTQSTEITSEILQKYQKSYGLKPQKSQIPFGLLVLFIAITFAVYISTKSLRLATFWVLGIGFGYVLQRSRFCFAAVFRDPIITGSTSLAKALLVAILLTSFGFWVIKLLPVVQGLPTNFNNENVYPIGLPMIIGGILFGIGMVIAGGCATGTLMRIGEGFSIQLVTLLFFIIGSFLGARDMSVFWHRFNAKAPSVFLPDVFGWVGALVIQCLIVLLLYIAAVKWQEKSIKNENDKGDKQ